MQAHVGGKFLLFEGSCSGVVPCLQHMRSLKRLDLDLVTLTPQHSNDDVWDVDCNREGSFDLPLPAVVELLQGFGAGAQHPEPGSSAQSAASLGAVDVCVVDPRSTEAIRSWCGAVRGLGAALEAGRCRSLSLGVETRCADQEATHLLAQMLLGPGVVSRLTRLGLRFHAAPMAVIGHLASLPCLPVLERVEASWRPGARGAGLLAAIARLAAPRLHVVVVGDHLPDGEEMKRELSALVEACVARPQPVDAAGEPVPLEVFTGLLMFLAGDVGAHAREALRAAGLSGRLVVR